MALAADAKGFTGTIDSAGVINIIPNTG